MNKEIILNCLKNNLQQFKEKYNIEQIGLFGSYARDEATEESDIDIFVKDIYEELYLHDPSDYTFNCFWQTPFPANQTVTSIIRNYLGTMNKQDIHTLCKKFGKDRVLEELNNKYKELFEIGFFDFKGWKIPLSGKYEDYELFKILLEIVNEFETN